MLEASTEMILHCGGGVRLMGAHAAVAGGDRPLVVLIHGWEGSSDSLYLMSLAARLFDGGCDVFRLNLRDHGGTQHLNRELFHSCRLSDVTGALAAIDRHFPGRRVMLAGFSLGGNFALRVACSAPAEGIVLHRVLAVSPVLDPHRTLGALDRGLPLYRHYFMRKWRRSLVRKAACFPDDYDFSRLGEFKTLASMTAHFVEEYTGFSSLDDYLRGYALVGDRLWGLKVPSVVVAAEDDPIIPGQDLDELAACPALHVVRVRHGGHCGFFDSWGFSSWLEESALRLFNPSGEAGAGRRPGG
jgi:predicted alpha/beta-fold hydrolase